MARQDIFLNFAGCNGRRSDSSTRWQTNAASPADIGAFGDYCNRLRRFANQPPHKATASREATAAQGRSRSTFDATCTRPAFARLRLGRHACHHSCRGSRVGCDDLDSAGDQPSRGFGLAGTPATTNEPLYRFRWFTQNYVAHQIAQTRFGVIVAQASCLWGNRASRLV